MKFVTSLLISACLVGPALAEADLKKGEKVFKKCKACHQVGEKAKNKTGPILNNLWGRKAAGEESFKAKKYSKALRAKGEEGLVWNDTTISAFIENPKKYIKGTKMAIKIKKEKDRVNLLGYLQQFSTPEAVEAANAAEQ
ncbi:MAG: cytochrome c family protein [Rhizobiaceae bacterium]